MKAKLYIVLLCFAALLPLSCIKESREDALRDENIPSEEGIVLNLRTKKLSLETKTPNPPHGEDERNENYYGSTVDVFFFTDDTPSAPIRKRKIAAPVYNGRVTISTTPQEVIRIFGSNTPPASCYVLVVANFHGSYEGCSTREDIDNLLLPLARWSQGNLSEFVMTGLQELHLNSVTSVTPASGDVGLERIAVKVSFELTVADSATSESSTDNVWEPITTGMTVYMVYAMRQANLGGIPTRLPLLAIGEKPVNYTNDLTDNTHLLYEYKALSLIDSGRTVSRTRQGVTTTEPVYITAVKDDHDVVQDQDVPFYAYPSSWDAGASNEPYLKLVIPWNNGKRTKYYYYKIPFSGTSLDRNNWYKISIDVQALGGEEPVPPPITVTYAVADWSGERDVTELETGDISVIPASVIASRYLTVPIKEYIMYNTDEVSIPITSSHNVEVIGFSLRGSGIFTADDTENEANYVGENPKIYNPFTSSLLSGTNSMRAAHPDYSQSTVQSVSTNFTAGTAPSSSATDYGWYVVPDGRNAVVVTHRLNRDMSSTSYDVAPWTLRFRIRHVTDSEGNENKYYEDVIIEQRPAIVIKPEPNSAGTDYRYVFVNGSQNAGANQTTSGSWWNQQTVPNTDGSWTSSTQRTAGSGGWTYYLGTSPAGLSNSNNKATSMYVIETSVLPTTGSIASYMLGDPRDTTPDNLGQSWSQSKTAWYGTSPRQITYYYPASTDAAYNNFIAPKIRIASSHGATLPMRFSDAQRRCASYQEDGYPAGRWRLPTKAEIEYIAKLNSDNKIELLLGSSSGTTDYFCNSGYMTVQQGRTPSYTAIDDPENDATQRYVRCVYDDWYWGSSTNDRLADSDKATFTWGDQPRSSVTAK